MDQIIKSTVDSMQDEIVSFLQKLVRIPSENPAGDYTEIANFLEKELKELGFEVKIIDAPECLVKEAGLEGPRKNIIATLKGHSEGKHLLFNSHIDTVPAGELEKWTFPPFSGEIDNGKIYGRGSTDSKGRLTSYIMAALALKRSGYPIVGDISIVATCDEETGGQLGAGYVIENKLIQGDYAIVEGYSNHIVRAMGGVLHLKIISYGKPAHAGFKWHGINAVSNIAKVIMALEGLQKEFEGEPSSIPGMRYTTVNVGTIKGGTKINVVPAVCEIEVDFRIIPEHSLAYIYDRVSNIIEEIQKNDESMKFTIEKISDFETEPTITNEDSFLIQELQLAIEEVKEKILAVVGVLSQSDARYFINNGIPAINYGPGTSENNLHGYDEFMSVDDLIETTKVLTTLAKNILSEER
jgi:succinyl-diaminopimelate desuccinylase